MSTCYNNWTSFFDIATGTNEGIASQNRAVTQDATALQLHYYPLRHSGLGTHVTGQQPH